MFPEKTSITDFVADTADAIAQKRGHGVYVWSVTLEPSFCSKIRSIAHIQTHWIEREQNTWEINHRKKLNTEREPAKQNQTQEINDAKREIIYV